MKKAALIFCIAAVFSACSNQKKTNENELLLLVLGEKNVLANGDSVFHEVGSFEFENQFHEVINEKTVTGKIYVADFFFATCQSICPQMSTQLTRVQKAFKNDPDFLILSHTVNPMHDTVEVLNQYAIGYGALKDKWHFLTGSKKEIYRIAKEGYLVNAIQDDGTEEGFLHTELFILVDKKKRLRGMYDGTDSVAVNKLIEDIKLLKTEK